MATEANFAERLTAWAVGRPDVEAVVLIGSQAGGGGHSLRQVDRNSDWDFQLVVKNPAEFFRADWTKELGAGRPLAYAVLPARVGSLPRISAVFPDTEVDLVIIPAAAIRKVLWALRRERHVEPGPVRTQLQDLAVVVRPGYRFLKAHSTWEWFYARACEVVPDPRLNDAAVVALAEAFYCQWVWIERKIARGEWRAAARMLVREQAETNFRLLHELKLRRGEPTFPDARRVELTASAEELAAISMEIRFERAALEAETEKAAQALRRLVKELVGDRWTWPL